MKWPVCFALRDIAVWFVSHRGSRRFGLCNGRFASVRATLGFGLFRFVVCGVAGREVFDRMCLDDSG